MGLNVKIGKGGHGLEVYDEEGKYAEDFSFDIDGQQIKGYEDFRSLCFVNMAQGSNGQYDANFLENLYNTNSDFKDQVDGQLYDEYNRLLTDAVNEHNAKQVWDTPEEAAKYLHELFAPNLVRNLLENKILSSNKSSVANNYTVDTFAACMQMSRYKKNRANVISAQEYNNLMSENKANGRLYSNSSVEETKNYIESAIKDNKFIPIRRNINGISYNDQQNILDSFTDENSPRHSCLAHSGAVNASYLGSVIYFSTGDYSYGSGSLSITGLVRMSDKLKLLQCPLTWSRSNESSCNRSIPEINKFRQAIRDDSDFDERIKQQLIKNGEIDEADARVILYKLKNEIEYNPGFCAILMGYDAIYGIGYHFDVLNLGVCDIVKR